MKIYYYILILCLLCSACNDFLEYKDNDKIIPKTLDHYNELVYGELIKKTNGDELLYLPFMTDEIQSVVLNQISGEIYDARKEYFSYFTWAENNQLDKDGKEKNDRNWESFYHKILMCNIIEHDISLFPDDILGMKKRLLGEVAFVRAVSYFYLLNLYGEPFVNKEQAKMAQGVPVNTAISVGIKVYERATLQENYDIIEKDLLKAIELLSAGEQLNSTFRPNIDVARLFLGRVYLYEKEWEKTITTCNELINNTRTKIETLEHMKTYDGNKIRLYASTTLSILYSWGTKYIEPLSTNTTAAGHWEVSKNLRDMFIDKDLRGKAFFYIKGLKHPHKYNSSNRTCYDRAYRIEEAYLNRAEAYIELGGATNISAGIQDINMIRVQRIDGYNERQTQDPVIARQYLRDEKKMEFCFEETRWFDIRRWNLEITHEFQDVANKNQKETYILKAGSRNYIMSIPLEVQRINDKIKLLPREKILPR